MIWAKDFQEWLGYANFLLTWSVTEIDLRATLKQKHLQKQTILAHSQIVSHAIVLHNSLHLQCFQLAVIWWPSRGGVKLEFVPNSFDSIQKFAIRLIRKAKNTWKIWWKSIRNSFDSTPTIGWNQIFRNWNSFDIHSIRFKNLQFDWFERWKNVPKIRWESIRNSYD